MDKNKKFYVFLGTTAELIKIAPVLKELRRRRVYFKLITTGQNEILFNELKKFTGDINVDISFETKKNKSSVVYFVFWAATTFVTALVSLRKEFGNTKKESTYVIVHGDTVSSLLGALVARFYGLKLAHVESGLRSYNFLEPFPEEISRFIISNLADIHFCPNSWAKNNLLKKTGKKINTR